MKIHGFTLQYTDDLKEYGAQGHLYLHEASGMEVYHVRNDDPENLFSFSIKTVSQDSTGIAHILEHAVLCGSERYPVKDPFALLMKGSMNTFLNAMTFPDKTVYPASSTVAKDLFNLMAVYADAVYFPLLSPEMFRQEGHRLEFDEEGVLQRTGVVWNEMKGNYSTHENVAADWTMRSLFPGTPYAEDSGGDPKHIPDLDYDTFRAFHRKLYHPSNTRVFLYGNIPTEDYLAFLAERVLARFDSAELAQRPEPVAPLRPVSFTEPRRLQVSYPADDGDEEDGKSSVSVNFLLPTIENPLDILAAELLSEVLIGSPASPLQRALVDSGLGEDLASTSGVETELESMFFSVGLRGTSPAKAGDIEALVLGTLENLARDGIDGELVEGTLRRFEFRAREIKGGPFGLRLLRRAMRGWNHGLPPRETMEFGPVMHHLRQALTKDPRTLEKLVGRWFIDNPHRTTVTVVPDMDMNAQDEAALRQELDVRQAAMGPEEKAAIIEASARLKVWQETPDDREAVASIPFLGREDIPAKVSTIPTEYQESQDGDRRLSLYRHHIFSNGISYLDLVTDLSHLEPEELALVPLFMGSIPSLGIPGTGYEEMARRLALVTGGFSAYAETSMTLDGSLSLRAFWRLKVLDDSLEEGWALARDLMLNADLSDTKRLRDLFTESRNDARSSILPSGNAYASLRSDRFLAPSEALEELWRGITQVQLLDKFERDLGNRVGDFLSRAFAHLRRKIQATNQLGINVTGQGSALDRGQDLLLGTVGDLRGASGNTGARELQDLYRDLAGNEAAAAWSAICREALEPKDSAGVVDTITLASKVAFASQSHRGPALGSIDYAAWSLLGHQLRTGQFWELIRMRGGAYGANASVDGLGRVITFSSYRDPRIGETFSAFREALEAIHSGAMDEDALLLAKIGVIGRDLRPLSPAEAGFVGLRRHLYGSTDEVRQQNRDHLIATSTNDVRRVAGSLLEQWDQAKRALVAGPEMVDKEEKTPGTFTFVRTNIGGGGI